MEDDVFYSLIEKIHNERGLDLTGYKTEFLKRRIAYRMSIIGVEKYDDYIKPNEHHQDYPQWNIDAIIYSLFSGQSSMRKNV